MGGDSGRNNLDRLVDLFRRVVAAETEAHAATRVGIGKTDGGEHMRGVRVASTQVIG